MASFAQLISRLEAEQALEKSLDRSMLGVDVEEEKIDLEEARSQYRDDVERAQLAMNRKARKRGRRGLLGSLIGAALSFTPLGAVGGALVGGLASSLGRSSVKPYSATISTSLPGGKFHAQARKDFSRDIASTNRFIEEAKQGQSLLDMTNAFSDALQIYGFQDTYGDDISSFFSDRRTRRNTIGNSFNKNLDQIDTRTLG